ncbi:cytochrome c family protein [Phyllobacterium phragmitis]|uniref:Cytochrome c family protein n=1 Tax=Phyllobacterium phragmitis TaxID=2670329 RepID=A0A2S9IUH3_9HYPH|nr:cytochrome c family protein [Phyllobacterium phragmitis]PRD44182.1 cytochrome c family protein [Phyllobacterium phragmitis]
MESSQSNKFIMAFLAAVFVVMSVSLFSDVIFDSPKPEKEGYFIKPLEASTGGEEKAAPVAVPIATLLQTADPKKGANVFKRCQACHTGEKGGPNKVGPDLWDIVDRPIASHPGFSYSAGMKEFAKTAKTWTYDHLNGFLTSPKNYVKGTAMGFAGDKNDAERADLIAYLRTLSDNPKPLPEAPAAAEQAAGDAAPAEGGAAQPAGEAEKPAGQAEKPAGEAEKPAENTAPAPQGEQSAPAQGEQPAAPAQPAPAQGEQPATNN